MNSDVFTVLVVCTGNVNQSALGAALLETWAGWYLPAPLAARVRVTSACLGAPVGRPRDRVAAIAGNRSVAVGDQDIIDPQGKDDEAYRLMARQEVPPLARIAGALFGMPSGDVAAYDEAADAAVFSFGEDRSPLDDTRTSPRGRREA